MADPLAALRIVRHATHSNRTRAMALAARPRANAREDSGEGHGSRRITVPGYGSSMWSAPSSICRALPAALLLLATLMAGCASKGPASTPAALDLPPPPVVLGVDRDSHGCIPSGGYAWCERRHRCERPWELAAEHGQPNSPESFVGACGGSPPASLTPPAPLPDPDATGLADTTPTPSAAEPSAASSPLSSSATLPPDAAAPTVPVPADAQR